MNQTAKAELAKKLPVPWWRTNGFLLGLLGSVVLAFLFPAGGSRGGVLHPDAVNNVGIALILFLQGVSLALEKVRSGAGNWRLHVLIQAYTFVVFPVVGVGLDHLLGVAWADAPEALRGGFLYLCVLPSTISTSVVLTAVARGNTAGALFNAAFSNILGVVVTPLLVGLLMRQTGQTGSFGPLLLQITLLTLVPFAFGMLVRPKVHAWVDQRKTWVTRLSNAVILFIVYTAFCDSVQNRIWATYGLALTLKAAAVVVALFVFISVLVDRTCRSLRLDRPDRIAAYFCSVKKTLAMGVPLAALIFGQRADLSLILLPIMLYHPLQLFCNGLLANRWARESEIEAVR